MTVTAQDIIDNAAGIADFINSSDGKTINELPTIASPDDAADYAHIWDASAGVDGKLLLDNLPGGGGGGSKESNPRYAAGSFDYPASNPAPLDTDTSGNGTIKRQLFDDSTNEKIIVQFRIPSDLGTGNVTFKLYGYATTAAASSDIVFNIKTAKASEGNGWSNISFVATSSGAKTTDSTQDNIDIFTWTNTVSTLGWSANDFCRVELVRNATDGGDTLSGDYGVIFLEIDIPRS